MTRFLYKFLFHPLAYLLLHLLKPFLNKKTQTMIQDKDSKKFHLTPGMTEERIKSSRPFWIHAASGEIEYARPVLRELQRHFPEVPIIITHSSPSAKKILEQLQGVSAWGPLPWDITKDCELFVSRWNPRACLIARTDVWPVMAETNHQHNIPTLLFAATFAENSSRLRGLSAKVTAWALSQLSAIHCVSNEDLKELARLKLNLPITIEGDTRFAQVLHRLDHPKPLKEAVRPQQQLRKKIFVAGSTWPEDEAVLLDAFQNVKSLMKLILVPHEVDEGHLQQVETLLSAKGLSSARYSKASNWDQEDVLVVDQVGLLAEIYQWGDFAFVGGSFKKQVHSVMEPLAAGLPVLVGPLHKNNREALQFKAQNFAGIPAVQEITNSHELVQKLNTLAVQSSHDFASSLRQEILTLSHSSKKVLQWCENLNLRR